MKLAERVVAAGGDAASLDTLAVAYAAAGRPEDALRTAREALAVAEEKGDEALAFEIRKRIERYEAGSQ